MLSVHWLFEIPVSSADSKNIAYSPEPTGIGNEETAILYSGILLQKENNSTFSRIFN